MHWVGDAIQSSHLLSSPSPPALNLTQHQGLFKWVSSSHQVAKVLEFELQYQSFQWTPRTDLLAVPGTLKSLLQHHSSKASILWHSDFFIWFNGKLFLKSWTRKSKINNERYKMDGYSESRKALNKLDEVEWKKKKMQGLVWKWRFGWFEQLQRWKQDNW